MMCEACERGDHANCGMQTWCECDCDPEQAEPFIEEYEDEPIEDFDDALMMEEAARRKELEDENDSRT